MKYSKIIRLCNLIIGLIFAIHTKFTFGKERKIKKVFLYSALLLLDSANLNVSGCQDIGSLGSLLGLKCKF